MFDMAKSAIGYVKNITMLQGNTKTFLESVLEGNDNILFWLNAHWSGGYTYGGNDECPLLEELDIIFRVNKNYAILIDDARLFIAPPPKPDNMEQLPTLKSIVETLPKNWEIIIYKDVIYFLPEAVNLEFREYIQVDFSKKYKVLAQNNSNIAKILKVIFKI